MVRHHVESLTDKARLENEENRKKYEENRKNKGKGGGRKGKGAQRLDMQDDHGGEPEDIRSAARRLLDSICVIDDSERRSGAYVRRYDPESEAIIEVSTQVKKRPAKKRKRCQAVTMAGIGRTCCTGLRKVAMGLIALSTMMAVCSGAHLEPSEETESCEEKIDEVCQGVQRDRTDSADRTAPSSSRRREDSLCKSSHQATIAVVMSGLDRRGLKLCLTRVRRGTM